MRIPVWLKVIGKRIIELPIIELAMLMPVTAVDLLINKI